MSPIGEALPCAFACYDIPALKHEAVEVIANRPKAAAYRRSPAGSRDGERSPVEKAWSS